MTSGSAVRVESCSRGSPGVADCPSPPSPIRGPRTGAELGDCTARPFEGATGCVGVAAATSNGSVAGPSAEGSARSATSSCSRASAPLRYPSTYAPRDTATKAAAARKTYPEGTRSALPGINHFARSSEMASRGVATTGAARGAFSGAGAAGDVAGASALAPCASEVSVRDSRANSNSGGFFRRAIVTADYRPKTPSDASATRHQNQIVSIRAQTYTDYEAFNPPSNARTVAIACSVV